MRPVDKCLQTLRVLIAHGDINAFGLAEKAVNEFLSAFTTPGSKIDALRHLEHELGSIDQAPGPQLDYIDLIFDYILNRRRVLSEKT
jgi:hypothetical protein